MNATENRERGVDVEDAVCERWPVEPAAPVSEKRGVWFDLRTTEAITTDRGGTIVEAVARIEVKSCWARYADRNGRWCIRKTNHDLLTDADGWYVLDRDSEAVRRMALARATTVDAIIDGNWWDANAGPAIRAFGHDIEDLNEHMDTFTWITHNTTMDVEEFSGAVERMAPDLQEIGLTLDETAIYMAALEERGITGRQAIQEMRQASNAAESDQEAFKNELGLTDQELQNQRQSLNEAEGATDDYATSANEATTLVDELTARYDDFMMSIGASSEHVEAASIAIGGLGLALSGIASVAPAVSTALGVAATAAKGIALAVAGLNPIVLGAIAIIGAFALAYKTNFLGVADITDAAIGRVKTVVGDLPGWLGTQKDRIMGVFGDLRTGVPRRTDQMADGVMSTVRGLNPIPPLRNTKDRVFGVFGDIRDGAEDRVQSGIDNVQNVFLNWTPYGIIWQKRNEIMDALPSPSDWWDRGTSLVSSFASGIESRVSDATDAVENVTEEVRDRLPWSPAKVGPLADLDETGPALVGELASGMESETGLAERASESVAQSASPNPDANAPTSSGGGGDTIIDFGSLPDDAWVRVDELKKAIKADLDGEFERATSSRLIE